MPDPAIEAAQRLLDRWSDLVDLPMDRDDLVAAAREALKPVREVIEEWRDQMPLPLWEELATRIYTTEELGR